MSTPLLTRVRLKREPSAAALGPVLLPADPDARAGAAHRLLWTLFADDPARRRDFLWREEGRGGLRPGQASFLVLSARPPEDPHALFDLEEPKPFAPVLARGDRLHFALRANPVVARRESSREGQRARLVRHDVVMDRLHDLPKGTRAEPRTEAIVQAGRDWLSAQGERAGFRLLDVAEGTPLQVDGYQQVQIGRDRGRTAIRFSTLDFTGTLEVTTPKLFVRALLGGFGKAKAFGCGLMLIRRA